MLVLVVVVVVVVVLVVLGCFGGCETGPGTRTLEIEPPHPPKRPTQGRKSFKKQKIKRIFKNLTFNKQN